MPWLTKVLEIIKFIISITNDNATLILVVITGVYVYFTYKMTKIMARQVVADIKVSDVVLRSVFLEDWFKERLEKEPEQIGPHSCFEFNLSFYVRNKGFGSGSLDKPVLILRFTNNNFEYKIIPNTKESWHEKLEEVGAMTTYRTVVNDLGGTIFLRGGESQRIELEYKLDDFGNDLLKHIKEDLDSLEYYFKFVDNLGKSYLMKINDIQK